MKRAMVNAALDGLIIMLVVVGLLLMGGVLVI